MLELGMHKRLSCRICSSTVFVFWCQSLESLVWTHEATRTQMCWDIIWRSKCEKTVPEHCRLEPLHQTSKPELVKLKILNYRFIKSKNKISNPENELLVQEFSVLITMLQKTEIEKNETYWLNISKNMKIQNFVILKPKHQKNRNSKPSRVWIVWRYVYGLQWLTSFTEHPNFEKKHRTI
jgi:hypothetical protein